MEKITKEEFDKIGKMVSSFGNYVTDLFVDIQLGLGDDKKREEYKLCKAEHDKILVSYTILSDKYWSQSV